MVNELNEMIHSILESNQDLLNIAVKQKSKFEGWLKFELAHALKQKYCDTRVEYPITDTKSHVDIYTNESFIELKTPNTNYQKEICEDCTRPITMNVTSIIGDIKKLNNPAILGKKRYIAFVMFPLDAHGAYKRHTDKIVPYLKKHKEAIAHIKGVPVLVFTGQI